MLSKVQKESLYYSIKESVGNVKGGYTWCPDCGNYLDFTTFYQQCNIDHFIKCVLKNCPLITGDKSVKCICSSCNDKRLRDKHAIKMPASYKYCRCKVCRDFTAEERNNCDTSNN